MQRLTKKNDNSHTERHGIFIFISRNVYGPTAGLGVGSCTRGSSARRLRNCIGSRGSSHSLRGTPIACRLPPFKNLGRPTVWPFRCSQFLLFWLVLCVNPGFPFDLLVSLRSLSYFLCDRYNQRRFERGLRSLRPSQCCVASVNFTPGGCFVPRGAFWVYRKPFQFFKRPPKIQLDILLPWFSASTDDPSASSSPWHVFSPESLKSCEHSHLSSMSWEQPSADHGKFNGSFILSVVLQSFGICVRSYSLYSFHASVRSSSLIFSINGLFSLFLLFDATLLQLCTVLHYISVSFICIVPLLLGMQTLVIRGGGLLLSWFMPPFTYRVSIGCRFIFVRICFRCILPSCLTAIKDHGLEQFQILISGSHRWCNRSLQFTASFQIFISNSFPCHQSALNLCKRWAILALFVTNYRRGFQLFHPPTGLGSCLPPRYFLTPSSLSGLFGPSTAWAAPFRFKVSTSSLFALYSVSVNLPSRRSCITANIRFRSDEIAPNFMFSINITTWNNNNSSSNMVLRYDNSLTERYGLSNPIYTRFERLTHIYNDGKQRNNGATS